MLRIYLLSLLLFKQSLTAPFTPVSPTSSSVSRGGSAYRGDDFSSEGGEFTSEASDQLAEMTRVSFRCIQIMLMADVMSYVKTIKRWFSH